MIESSAGKAKRSPFPHIAVHNKKNQYIYAKSIISGLDDVTPQSQLLQAASLSIYHISLRNQQVMKIKTSIRTLASPSLLI